MSPVLDDPRDELAVRVSDAPREKSSCAHLAFGFARPFLHYRPPPLVALPTPCPPRITEPGVEGGAAFRNLRSGSIHTAPNPAVKARASFCSWGQQGHMQWLVAPSPSDRAQARPWPLLVVLHCILPAPVESCEFPLR